MESQMLKWRELLLEEKAATPLGDHDEVLVIDSRSGVTPAQMVDQKLVALLRTGHSRPLVQATDRPQDR
jgi:hypothetical protein